MRERSINAIMKNSDFRCVSCGEQMLTLMRAVPCFSPKCWSGTPLSSHARRDLEVFTGCREGSGGLPLLRDGGRCLSWSLVGSGEVTGSHGGAGGVFLQLSLGPSLLGGKLFFINCSLGKLCYC